MEFVKMTYQEFVEFLNNVKGCQFINISAITDVKMNKGGRGGTPVNPFYGRVQQFTEIQKQFGYDYENAVNNRLRREGKEGAGTFKVSNLPWGSWLSKEMTNKVLSHKDMLYIRTYSVRNAHSNSYYIIDGHKASKEEVEMFKPFLKEKDNESQKQSEAGLEIEYQVQPRDYKFSSIVSITINKKKIKLVL